MSEATIDVVIPVWNRPNETRNCLVNLINYSPGARLVMYDNGSERDTEKLLQEFADGLEERALLMRDDANLGFVRAANRGLARTEAPYLALVRNTTQVSAGWLEPILAFAQAHPDAGILQPCLVDEDGGDCRGPMELQNASFAALVITRRLFQEIGGFDEGLDGGIWCLRDYTRRATSRGFRSYRIPGAAVRFTHEQALGSELRRQETLEKSRALFRERWGEGQSYLLHVPKGVESDLLGSKLDVLLKGARHDDRYTLLMPAALHKAAQKAKLDLLHENVRLVPLPRLTGNAGRKRCYEKLVAEEPGCQAVTAVDGIAFPWSDRYLSFSDLAQRIAKRYEG